MDSDCLVKLTKAGAKEAVMREMEVYIPHLVKKETVDEAKKRGYQDASIIEKNIDKRALQVVRHKERVSVFPAVKGETAVVSLYTSGGDDVVARDDRRFLRKLEAANIPYLTPATCIIYIYKNGRIVKSKALEILENMKLFISSEEYRIARFYLEGKT